MEERYQSSYLKQRKYLFHVRNIIICFVKKATYAYSLLVCNIKKNKQELKLLKLLHIGNSASHILSNYQLSPIYQLHSCYPPSDVT